MGLDTLETLIFDLGDVLFSWSANTRTSVPPQVFRKFLVTETWFDYEMGRISEECCYTALASQAGLDVRDVEAAFHSARESLTPRLPLINLIRAFKPRCKVYAMSNISAPDWEYLSSKYPECNIFDHVFTSADVGERKPNVGFYRHVLRETGANPRHTIFVDDKVENILTARSLGITGIVYSDFHALERRILNLSGDALTRARTYMRSHARRHLSFTTTGRILYEHFTQLLILEATNDPSLVTYNVHEGPLKFFDGGDIAATWPCDVDTTSIALTVTNGISKESKHSLMDQMLTLRNVDNILEVYFDKSRLRLDPIVCVNALTFFYANGRGEELEDTFRWVESVLVYRAYEDGTRYYLAAEAFLYFLSRLLEVSAHARRRLGALYFERCKERVGMDGDALALGMRIFCCAQLGLDATVDVQKLRALQDADGGWSDAWFYRVPSSGELIGNRGYTTAMAIKALELVSGAQ